MFIFDGQNKLISLNLGVTSFQVIDLYSRWKDWVTIGDNAKFSKAFRTFGGDATTNGQFAPSYFFLTNDWRLFVNDRNLQVEGNLYTDEGTTPFINSNSTITHKTSDASQVSTSGVDLSQVLFNQGVINRNVKKASLLIPANEDLS